MPLRAGVLWPIVVGCGTSGTTSRLGSTVVHKRLCEVVPLSSIGLHMRAICSHGDNFGSAAGNAGDLTFGSRSARRWGYCLDLIFGYHIKDVRAPHFERGSIVVPHLHVRRQGGRQACYGFRCHFGAELWARCGCSRLFRMLFLLALEARLHSLWVVVCGRPG